MYAILRMLLIFIHFLYALLEALRNCCLMVRRKCTEFRYGENLRTEVEMLVQAASRSKNLPRHLVIIFGHKEDNILDCIRIIGWCITLGIPNISFFDSNGILKRNESFLKNEVTKRRPDLIEHISWGKCNAGTSRNGITGSKFKIRVLLLSDADGKGEIVALTRELAKAVTTGSIKSDEINHDLLSEKLKLLGIPNPDLAFIYGHICSTYGIMPWHTRITEFLMLPMYNSLSVMDFIYLLDKYNTCEQRYGK